MGSSWCMDWVAATTCIQCFAGALRPSPEPKRTSTCWNGLLLTCFKRLPCCRRLLRIDLSETIPLLETPCTSTVAPDQRDNLRGRRLIPRSGLVHRCRQASGITSEDSTSRGVRRFTADQGTPRRDEVVAWAASNGDRSENADYQ